MRILFGLLIIIGIITSCQQNSNISPPPTTLPTHQDAYYGTWECTKIERDTGMGWENYFYSYMVRWDLLINAGTFTSASSTPTSVYGWGYQNGYQFNSSESIFYDIWNSSPIYTANGQVLEFNETAPPTLSTMVMRHWLEIDSVLRTDLNYKCYYERTN